MSLRDRDIADSTSVDTEGLLEEASPPVTRRMSRGYIGDTSEDKVN